MHSPPVLTINQHMYLPELRQGIVYIITAGQSDWAVPIFLRSKTRTTTESANHLESNLHARPSGATKKQVSAKLQNPSKHCGAAVTKAMPQ